MKIFEKEIEESQKMIDRFVDYQKIKYGDNIRGGMEELLAKLFENQIKIMTEIQKIKDNTNHLNIGGIKYGGKI